MSDFESALRAKLERNAELAGRRDEAEREMDRVAAERRADTERRQQELAQARRERHSELVAHLEQLATQLKASSPDSFIVRQGWSESREEFITRISTRQLHPARRLFIELDRDDDEVLARWSSDLGNSVELWRLLDVEPETLTELVLQIADQEAWQGLGPPPFPGAR